MVTARRILSSGRRARSFFIASEVLVDIDLSMKLGLSWLITQWEILTVQRQGVVPPDLEFRSVVRTILGNLFASRVIRLLQGDPTGSR
jgi:hypothetical protein